MNPKPFLLIIIAGICLAGCSNNYHKFISQYSFSSSTGLPDYSNLDYWAAHPNKKDPSDSVPKPLLDKYYPDTSVDVFFIHPTTYTENAKEFGSNANIDNARLNAKTDYSTILFQASVFNEAGRIFSPRYRQAHLSCYFPKNAMDTLEAYKAFEIAYQDVKTAFEYYLEHFNNGHPIIIASHSQGTTHAKRLLKEFFDGTALQKKLVAAYLVGMAVDPGDYRSLKPCNKPEETGCMVSWRTFKNGFVPSYLADEKFQAVVTNPITWDARIPNADRLLNPGGILLNFNKIVPNVTNASISGNVLWADKPHFFGNLFYTTKVYHVADLNLYYLSIRNNVKLRSVAFQKK